MRSQQWFAGREELAFQNRSALRSMGLNPDDFVGKPVIGIANSWSDLNNCNANLRDLAEAVKRGVLLEGGLPLEFPTISLGEEFMKPSAMLYRNLMAMDVEETLRANPIDGVVLLCNCDKTTPGAAHGGGERGLAGDSTQRRPASDQSLSRRADWIGDGSVAVLGRTQGRAALGHGLARPRSLLRLWRRARATRWGRPRR